MIDGKIGKVVHVINIRPDSVHRKPVLAHIAGDIGEIFQKHIAPSALVVSVRPERLDSPSVDVIVVHFDNGVGIFVTQENL